MSSTQDFEVKTQSNSANNIISPTAPVWEMPPRGDSYFQFRISRNTSIAIIFSLLVHLLLLMTLAPKLLNMGEPPAEAQQSLVVQLNQPSAKKAEVVEPVPEKPEPAPIQPKPKPVNKVKPKPEVKPPPKPQTEPQPDIMSVEKPSLNNLKVPPPRIQPDQAAPTDMASYVKAQRERRMAAQGYTEKDNAEVTAKDTPMSEDDRRNKIIKKNLEQEGVQGIYEIRDKRLNTAQFSFTTRKSGDARPRMLLIDVRVGSDGDIDRAIVKKLMALLLENYPQEFSYHSLRLGREVLVSQRPEDKAGLEEFLIKEVAYTSAGFNER